MQKKYDDIITGSNGKVIKIEKWGLINFARKIKTTIKTLNSLAFILSEPSSLAKVDGNHILINQFGSFIS
jgi:ribosomal protein S6